MCGWFVIVHSTDLKFLFIAANAMSLIYMLNSYLCYEFGFYN
jgi:hypothetical protein